MKKNKKNFRDLNDLRSSYFRGAGSVFDIGGYSINGNIRRILEESREKSIADDFNSIGQDISKAISDLIEDSNVEKI